jgi:hypothetical protein
MQTYRDKLADQQEVLMHLADMLIDTFSAELVAESGVRASNAPPGAGRRGACFRQ